MPHSRNMPSDTTNPLAGLFAAGALMVGLVTSFQEQAEWGMRMLSMVLACIVSIVTIIVMLRKMKRGSDDR